MTTTWLDKMADFLLGPSPHPTHLAAAAAGFGGAVDRSAEKRNDFVAKDGHEDKGTEARPFHGD